MKETTEILEIDAKKRVRTPREKKKDILHDFEAHGG